MDPLKQLRNTIHLWGGMNTIVVIGEQMSNCDKKNGVEEGEGWTQLFQERCSRCPEKFIFGHLDEIKLSPG